MIMELNQYINEAFPGLVIKPSLYWQWKSSIHFNLAMELSPFKDGIDKLNPQYFKETYEKAILYFNELFSDDDEIFLVTNYYHHKKQRISRHKLKVYAHYIKNKDIKFRLQQKICPYVFEEEEEAKDYCTSQFSLLCRKRDIRYPLLLEAICNQDFPPLKPNLRHRDSVYSPNVFFINASKDIIFFIYDDRGCEVIAKDFETIRPLYEKYTEWVEGHRQEEQYKEI